MEESILSLGSAGSSLNLIPGLNGHSHYFNGTEASSSGFGSPVNSSRLSSSPLYRIPESISLARIPSRPGSPTPSTGGGEGDGSQSPTVGQSPLGSPRSGLGLSLESPRATPSGHVPNPASPSFRTSSPPARHTTSISLVPSSPSTFLPYDAATPFTAPSFESPSQQYVNNIMIQTREDSSESLKKKHESVLYINDDFLKRYTKKDLKTITSLTISLSDQKIKKIEGLEALVELEVLDLSHNKIKKIEGLEKLIRLKEVRLADNLIQKIENLNTLRNLEVLDLSCNKIDKLPMQLHLSVPKLRKLNLAKNGISALREIEYLANLKNLTEINISENPIATLPHFRDFVIFHLKTLQILNNEFITPQERVQAKQRFDQVELDRKKKDLDLKDKTQKNLEGELSKYKAEIGSLQKKLKISENENTKLKSDIQDLQQKYNASTEIVRTKTIELNRALEELYELKQRLADANIDSSRTHHYLSPMVSPRRGNQGQYHESTMQFDHQLNSHDNGFNEKSSVFNISQHDGISESTMFYPLEEFQKNAKKSDTPANKGFSATKDPKPYPISPTLKTGINQPGFELLPLVRDQLVYNVRADEAMPVDVNGATSKDQPLHHSMLEKELASLVVNHRKELENRQQEYQNHLSLLKKVVNEQDEKASVELKKFFDDIAAELTKLQNARAEDYCYPKMKQKLEILMREIKTLSGDKAKSEQTIAELNKELQSVRSEIDALLKSKESDMGSLSKELQDAKAKIDALLNRNAQLEQELLAASKTIEQLQRHQPNRPMIPNDTLLKEQIEQLEEELVVAKQELDAARRTIDEQNKKYKQQLAFREEAEAEIEESKRQVETLLEENEQLRMQLAAYKNKILKMKESYQLNSQNEESLQLQIHNLINKIKELNIEVERKEHKIAQLKFKLKNNIQVVNQMPDGKNVKIKLLKKRDYYKLMGKDEPLQRAKVIFENDAQKANGNSALRLHELRS